MVAVSSICEGLFCVIFLEKIVGCALLGVGIAANSARCVEKRLIFVNSCFFVANAQKCNYSIFHNILIFPLDKITIYGTIYITSPFLRLGVCLFSGRIFRASETSFFIPFLDGEDV